MKRRVTAWLMVCLLMLASMPAQAEDAPELTHYLLLGFDFWGDERIGVSYSDTNILASIDHTNGRLMITSLLRDTYVEKPDGSWGRLNNIVRDEGFDVMVETVSLNYGVEIEAYIAIGVKGLRRIIDQLGGIEITVTRAEAEKMTEVSGINGPGTYTVGASGAMAYMRLRKIAGHDFGRTERQRKVLTQVFSQLQNMTSPEALVLASMLFEEVETDITLMAMMQAIKTVYDLREKPLETFSLPIDGGYTNIKKHGMDVYELDWEANRQALAAFLSGE